jgi:hypothetical protein
LPVNGLEVRGVELPLGAVTSCYFKVPCGDETAFKTLELIVADRPQLVFKTSVRTIADRVARHGLSEAKLRFETGNDLRHVNLTAHERLENRVGFRIAR